MPFIPPDLAAFLVEAKRRMRASTTTRPSPRRCSPARSSSSTARHRFHGIETITRHDGTPLYELRYGGGLLR